MSKEEWYEFWLILKPNGTREEFEKAWERFEKLLAMAKYRRSLQ